VESSTAPDASPEVETSTGGSSARDSFPDVADLESLLAAGESNLGSGNAEYYGLAESGADGSAVVTVDPDGGSVITVMLLTGEVSASDVSAFDESGAAVEFIAESTDVFGSAVVFVVLASPPADSSIQLNLADTGAGEVAYFVSIVGAEHRLSVEVTDTGNGIEVATIMTGVTNATDAAAYTVTASYGEGSRARSIVLESVGPTESGWAYQGVLDQPSGFVIVSARADGPYQRTAQASEFVQIDDPSILTGNFEAELVDDDNDGRYDTLRLRIEVDVPEAGRYILSGRITGSDGTSAWPIGTDEELESGLGEMVEDAPFDWLRDSGATLPLLLTELSLSSADLNSYGTRTDLGALPVTEEDLDGITGPVMGEAELRSEIAAARVLWEAAALTSYTYMGRVCRCDTDSFSLVSVANSEIESVDNFGSGGGAGEPDDFWTIPSMLDRAEELLDEGRLTRFAAHQYLGFPVEVSTSRDARFGRGEIWVRSFDLIPGDETREMLAERAALWSASAPSSYSFEVRIFCGCGDDGDWLLTVEDGILVSAVDDEGNPPADDGTDPLMRFPSIDGIFERLNEVLDDPEYIQRFNIAFDPGTGRPTMFTAMWDRTSAGLDPPPRDLHGEILSFTPELP